MTFQFRHLDPTCREKLPWHWINRLIHDTAVCDSPSSIYKNVFKPSCNRKRVPWFLEMCIGFGLRPCHFLATPITQINNTDSSGNQSGSHHYLFVQFEERFGGKCRSVRTFTQLCTFSPMFLNRLRYVCTVWCGGVWLKAMINVFKCHAESFLQTTTWVFLSCGGPHESQFHHSAWWFPDWLTFMS